MGSQGHSIGKFGKASFLMGHFAVLCTLFFPTPPKKGLSTCQEDGRVDNENKLEVSATTAFLSLIYDPRTGLPLKTIGTKVTEF